MIRILLGLLFAIMPAAAWTQDVAVSERREADGSATLSHEIVVDASQADVWAAIATADGWRGWAAPVARMVDGETLETSYQAGAAPGDPSTIHQQFAAILPGRLLVFRTTKAPAGFPNFEAFRHVTHFFELESAGDGRTRIRLTGVGYADDAAGRQLLGFFRNGNRISLEHLRRRFVDGPVDWTRVARN